MIALLAVALLAAPGEIPAPVRAFYGADPQLAQKARIEEIMGVYLVDPPRRHESERITLEGGRIRVDLWHPVGRSSDTELKTRAVKWLVFGRTKYATGARGVFSEVPGAQEVVLVFHEVVRPDEKGRRRSAQKDQINRYLAIKLERDRFERMNLEAFEGCISRGDCGALFRSAFGQTKFDRAYTAARRREGP